MTSHETAIAERLREAADRIPVDTSAMPTVEVGGRRVVVVRPPIGDAPWSLPPQPWRARRPSSSS